MCVNIIKHIKSLLQMYFILNACNNMIYNFLPHCELLVLPSWEVYSPSGQETHELAFLVSL